MARRFKPWSERIAAAEVRGKFTKFEYNLVEDWTRCAVGEKYRYKQSPNVQVQNWDADWEKSLEKVHAHPEYILGMEFSAAVIEINIPEAKRLYEAIMALP